MSGFVTWNCELEDGGERKEQWLWEFKPGCKYSHIAKNTPDPKCQWDGSLKHSNRLDYPFQRCKCGLFLVNGWDVCECTWCRRYGTVVPSSTSSTVSSNGPVFSFNCNPIACQRKGSQGQSSVKKHRPKLKPNFSHCHYLFDSLTVAWCSEVSCDRRHLRPGYLLSWNVRAVGILSSCYGWESKVYTPVTHSSNPPVKEWSEGRPAIC